MEMGKKKEYREIKKSGLFNTFYYLKENKDVRQADIDPLKHFIRYGWKEERNPSLLFNTSFYLDQNADVRQAKVNPLYHFIRHGFREGRKPNTETEPYIYWCLFTSKRKGIILFIKKIRDVLTIHRSGMFDKEFYMSQNLDGQVKFDKSVFWKWKNIKKPIPRILGMFKILTVVHYVFQGVFEWRDPNSEFSTANYINNNADLRKEKYINPFAHYLERVENNNISSVNCSTDHNYAINLSLYNEISSIPVTPEVDIIICVGPRQENVRACLSSIRKYTKEGTYSLHLVSHKKDLSNISDILTPDIHVYPHEMDLFNYSKANNMAIRHCENDVVLLNDDTEVTVDWLYKLRDASKGIALTGAHTGYKCSGNPHMWGEGSVRTTNYPINTFCAYIPRRIIEVVGLFDPEFAYYGGDDVDYSCRALQNGFPLVVSDAYVIHKKNQSYRETKDALMCESDKIIEERYGLKTPFKLTDLKPIVSIIMYTHNRPALLLQALDSIERVDYNNYELIVVDDCSPEDETNKILINYQSIHNNLTLIKLGKNCGLSKARKLGLDMSHGQFILFTDDDIVVLSNRISSPLEYMLRHPSLDVVYCDYNVFSQNGKLLPMYKNIAFDLEAYLNMDFHIGSGTLFGRKQAFTDVEFMSRYDKAAVTYDWVFRLLRRGYKIEHCPEVVINYNHHRGSSEYYLSSNLFLEEAHKNIRKRELLLKGLLRKND